MVLNLLNEVAMHLALAKIERLLVTIPGNHLWFRGMHFVSVVTFTSM